MEIGEKAGHARSSSLSYPPAPQPYQSSSTPFPCLEPPEVHALSFLPPSQLPLSLPQSLNQSQWQPAERRKDLTSWRIAKQERGVERLLWKKLVRQLLAVSVTAERETEALTLCVELESDLSDSAVSEVLVRFTEKALRLYTKEEREEPDREFLVSLLEQQNAQLAEMREQESHFQSASKETLEGQIAALTLELQSVRSAQAEHQQALDQKLKSLEESRKLAAREKTALQEAYSRLSLSLQSCTKDKSQLESELTTLRKQLHLESCEKLQITEDLAKSTRSLESSRLRIFELEQELSSSPFSHLHSIGEQLGTQFATVSDLFAYLTANLEAADPDQSYLVEAYKGLSGGLGSHIQAPSFIAAMLSFLLIRKKMIEEERELQGHTLLGLKKQLESAQMELEVKAKAYFRVSLEANELKLQAKTLTLDGDLLRKQAAGSEEELKVLRKAHERHIELYRTELDSVQRRLSVSEKSALDKGLEVESIRKEMSDLAGKLASLEEENAALEHENSFLAYEKSELQKGHKHKYGTTSLQELNSTLSDIQQALKKQQAHEKELEMVISSLHLQLEDREAALSQAVERGKMGTEEIMVRDRERLGMRTGGLMLRADRDHLTREVAELAQQIAYLYRENEDLQQMLDSDRRPGIEAKYFQLKGLYSRLETLCGRLLPVTALSSANASLTDMDGKELQLREIEKVLELEAWDQASEVVRTEESAISAGNSLFAGERRVVGTVRLQGVLWTLRGEGPEQCYWTREGEDWEETGRRLGVYRELEALVQPYMREFEDVTLAFSRILQDYEQLGRSRPVSPEPLPSIEEVRKLIVALSQTGLSL